MRRTGIRGTVATPLCKSLSNWEVAELYQDYKRGVKVSVLKQRYRLNSTSLRRVITRFEELGRRVT